MPSNVPAKLILVCLPLALAGCAVTGSVPTATPVEGLAIQGTLHGGQQPVSGSHVYLMAASASGYGKASTSLLTAGDGSDANGTYVLSSASGAFLLTNKYTCTANMEVYVLALGGKPSPTSASNSGLALMAALGPCPAANTFAGTVPYISINEVTTAAAAYALSGFMTSPTALSYSGTTLAYTGLNNAFSTAASLANVGTGGANASVGSNGTASVAKLNTLADIISPCVNSDGTGSACSMLYSDTTVGSATPADTVTALLNIAHHPGSNVSALYNLTPPAAPFQPTLTTTPNDLALTIRYTTPSLSSPLNIRADASGNLWFRDGGSSLNEVEKIGPTGAVLSGASGYAFGGQGGGDSLALDSAGDVFLGNRSAFAILKLSPSGMLLSPANGYAGTCDNPNANLFAVALDGNGNVWGSGSGGCALKISNTGTVLSGANGYPSTSDDSYSLALDSTNAAWITGVADNVVRRISATGTILATYGSTLYTPYSIAIDASDSAWVANRSQNLITHILASGTTTGISGGGLASPIELAIDGASAIWVANNSSTQISAFSNAGVALSPSTGYTAASSGTVRSVTVDGSGNVWTAMNGPDVLVEFVGIGTPVARPIMPGQLGQRP